MQPAQEDIDPQPLSDLLARLAEELSDLQFEGRTVEDAIADSILGEGPTTSETLANLQRIDLIVQTLGELGGYVEAITRLLAEEQHIDMSGPLARITLRDLARKLSGGKRVEIVDDQGAVSGEVDLF